MGKEIPTDRHITYRQQYRTCGKTFCKQCRLGKGHGPYWYAEWWEKEKVRTAYVGKNYIGKNLPAGVHRQKRKRER